MLKIKQLCSIALVLTLAVSHSASATTKTNTLMVEYNHYENGKTELNAGNYQAAIQHYTTLGELYPNSTYIQQAQLETAYAYYKLGDNDATISILTQFIADNKKHPHLPYVYYLAGLSQYHYSLNLIANTPDKTNQDGITNSTEQTLAYFSTLVDNYPDSQYTKDARDKTSHLLEKVILYRVSLEEKDNAIPRRARIWQESERAISWLMKQPKNRYTLQLVRDPNYDNVFKVAVQYKLANKATIIETHSAAGTEYTLLYGVYSTKRRAMEAGSRLPNAILDSKPSVIKLSTLKTEIKQSRVFLANQSPQPKTQNNDQTETASTLDASISAMFPQGIAYREPWLLEQNPQYFTIQVSGLGDEKHVISYIKKHNLVNNAAYFKTNREGKQWFSLLHGSYEDKQSAIEASEKLSSSLGIKHPWVRSYKSVQTSIRNAQ